MITGLFVAISLFGHNFHFVRSQLCPDPGSSCVLPDTCKKVPIDQSVPDTLSSTKPYFNFINYDSGSTEVDNVCVTKFDIGDDISIMGRTETYMNGSYTISTLLTSFVSPGVQRRQGKQFNSDGCSSCVTNDYFINFTKGACSGIDVHIVYRCFLYGDCGQRNGEDYVAAFSTSQDVSEACHNRVRYVASSLGLNLGTFSELPNRLPKNCVTRIGNLTAVSACSVSACDSIQLDYDPTDE